MCCTGESSCGGMPCRPATASRPPPPFAEFISGFRLPHLPLSFFLSQVSSDGVNWAPVCPSCIQRRGRTLQRRSCCFVQNISRFRGSCIRFDEMEPSADYRNYHSLPSIIGQWLKVTCHNEGTAGCSMKERGASGSLGLSRSVHPRRQEVFVHGIPAADVSLAELEELAQRPPEGPGISTFRGCRTFCWLALAIA